MDAKHSAQRDAHSRAVASHRLSAQMLKLDERIDRAVMGSAERLTLLREQATLSDRRETLRDRARRGAP